MLTQTLQYDDFVAAHIQHTLSIHLTGNFLPWHRWLIHEYERALREEFGYKGYQPVCIPCMKRGHSIQAFTDAGNGSTGTGPHIPQRQKNPPSLTVIPIAWAGMEILSLMMDVSASHRMTSLSPDSRCGCLPALEAALLPLGHSQI